MDAVLTADSIDCSGAWLFWAEAPQADFIRLLEKMGQLEPVLIAEEGEHQVLVTGYKRVQACRNLGRRVRIRYQNANDLMKGRIYLHLNMNRQLSGSQLLKAARFFQSIRQQDDSKLVLKEFEDLISMKKCSILDSWLGLEFFWDQALHAGRVPFEAGPVLSVLYESERQACKAFFRQLSWSWNKFRNFFEPLLESARRDRSTLEKIISREGLLEYLDMDLSPNDCQKALLQCSHRIRYPGLYRLESDFSRLQEQFRRTSRWRILPEQHFESNGVNLQTKIRTQEDVQHSLEQLQKLAAQEAFAPIWQWQQEHLD